MFNLSTLENYTTDEFNEMLELMTPDKWILKHEDGEILPTGKYSVPEFNQFYNDERENVKASKKKD